MTCKILFSFISSIWWKYFILFIFIFKLLIDLMQSSGSDTDPWDTPLSTLEKHAITQTRWTHCILFLKWELMKIRGSLLTPSLENFDTKSSCAIQSKAVLRSEVVRPILLSISRPLIIPSTIIAMAWRVEWFFLKSNCEESNNYRKILNQINI